MTFFLDYPATTESPQECARAGLNYFRNICKCYKKVKKKKENATTKNTATPSSPHIVPVSVCGCSYFICQIYFYFFIFWLFIQFICCILKLDLLQPIIYICFHKAIIIFIIIFLFPFFDEIHLFFFCCYIFILHHIYTQQPESIMLCFG